VFYVFNIILFSLYTNHYSFGKCHPHRSVVQSLGQSFYQLNLHNNDAYFNDEKSVKFLMHANAFQSNLLRGMRQFSDIYATHATKGDYRHAQREARNLCSENFLL